MSLNRAHLGIGRRLGGLAKTCVIGLAIAGVADRVVAGPVNPVIVYGDVTFIPLGGGKWEIVSGSNRSIVNYTSFDIASNENVFFNLLKGKNARFLNRIQGDFDGTQINGTLRSNGIIYFVNPAGVYFGSGAVVDVGGIYAAAGTISDSDFKDGVDKFTNLSGPVEVANGAKIGGQKYYTTRQVHLIGQMVANHGTIKVENGVVTMLAGDKVVLHQLGSGPHVAVEIDGHAFGWASSAVPGGGTFAGPGVENTGTITATGNSHVVLGAGDMYSLAVRNTGTINADGGSVVMGGFGGDIENSGTINATSGSVDMWTLKGDVENSGTIDVSGTDGSLTMRTKDGDVSNSGSIDASGGAVEMATDSGSVTHNGTELRADSLTMRGDDIYLSSDINANESEFDGAVTLQGDVAIEGQTNDSQASSVSFLSSVDGAFSLDINSAETYFDGDVGAGDALFSLSITGKTWAKGDIYATHGLAFGDDLELDGSGDQTVDAGAAGLLDANGDISKTTVGSLTLAGVDGIDVAGSVINEEGSLIFKNDALVGADVRAEKSSVLFEGTADVMNSVYAKTWAKFMGDATVGGEVWGETEFVEFEGTADVDGDVKAGTSIDFKKTATLGGDVLAGTDIHFWDDAEFDDAGKGDQLIDAGGALTADGDLTKTTVGSLTLAGDLGIDVTGSVINEEGSLIFKNDALVGVDVWSKKSSVLFEGTSDVDGDVKAGTSIDFKKTAKLGGDVLAGTDIHFWDDAEFNHGAKGNQRVEAGGTLWAEGMLTKITGGTLSLAGDTIDLDGSVDVLGSLVIEDDFSAAGDLLAGESITLQGAGTLDGTSNQTIDAEGGTLWAWSTLTKTEPGDLILGGADLIDIDGTVEVESGGLTVEDYGEFAGHVLAGDGIQFKADAVFDGGAKADQTVDAGSGALIAAGDLWKTTSGDLTLAGDLGIDVTGSVINDEGALIFKNDALVGVDVWSKKSSVLFEGTSDVGGDVLAKTFAQFDGAAAIDGDVEAGTSVLFGSTSDVGGSVTAGTTATFVGDAVVDGNVWAKTGMVDFQSKATLGGNVTGVGIHFGDDATFVGGKQTVHATTGKLLAEGSLTKTTAGDFALGGETGIEVLGSVIVDDGELTFRHDATVGGDVMSSNGSVLFKGTADVGNNVYAKTWARFMDDATVGGDVSAETDFILFEGTANVTKDVHAKTWVEFQDDATIGGDVWAETAFVDFQGTADVEGDVEAGTSIDFRKKAWLGGDVIAGTDIHFWEDAEFDNSAKGDQLIDAGGKLIADGDLTKTTTGDLTLAGDLGIDVAGSVINEEGALTFENDAKIGVDVWSKKKSVLFEGKANVGNNVYAKTWAKFMGDATVGGDVWAETDFVEFGQKSDISGSVTAGTTATFVGDAVVDGDVTGGGLVDFQSKARLRGDVTGNGIHFGGDAQFIGADQRIDATSGQLWADSSLWKMTVGSLTLAGMGGIDIEGNVTVQNGALTFEDNADVLGNVWSKKGLVDFQGTASLGGDVTGVGITFAKDAGFYGGDQTVDATTGTLWAKGDLTKTSGGSLTLGGDALIDVDGTVDVQAGGLIVEDFAKFGGDVLASSGIHFMKDAEFDNGAKGDQVIDAGTGLLDADGDLWKSTAGALTLGGDAGIDVEGDVTVENGVLTFEDNADVLGNVWSKQDLVKFQGTASLGGNVTGVGITFEKDATFYGNGNQKADAKGGKLWAWSSLTKTGTGDLTLAGIYGIDVAGSVINNKGALIFQNNAKVGQDVWSKKSSVDFQGTADVDGDVTAYTDATFGGTAKLAGDVTAGKDITFKKDVTFDGGKNAQQVIKAGDEFQAEGDVLIANKKTTIEGVKGVTIDGRIDAAAGSGGFQNRLLVRSDKNVLFGGNIGQIRRLGAFEIDVEGLTTFEGSMIRTKGDIVLNEQTDLASIPDVATIGSVGNLFISSSQGKFIMGKNQKLSVAGTLDLNAKKSATLGDLNTLGDMRITAGKIYLLSRPGGPVFKPGAGRAFDLGVDYVAGGRFFFSVKPTVLGGGFVQFANPDGTGDALGTLADYVMRAFGEPLTMADLRGSNVFYDLVATGPSTTDIGDTIAGAFPRDSERERVGQDAAAGAGALERLASELNLVARGFRPEELAELTVGRSLYFDSGQTTLYRPEEKIVVNKYRLLADQVEVTAATLNQLTRDRGRSEADMQEDLKNAWNAYCESLGEAGQPNASGFVSYLGEQDLKDSLSDLQVLHQLLRDIELLGLTRREQVGDSFSPKRWIITKIMPGAIVADDPEMVLADQIIAEAAQQPLATMEQAGQQPPPAPF